jgi:hypothetical protein
MNMTRFRLRLRAHFTRRRDDVELAREMASHLALLEEEHRRRGLSQCFCMASACSEGSDPGDHVLVKKSRVALALGKQLAHLLAQPLTEIA